MLLDMCAVRAEPVLNFYVEHIDLPKDVIKQFNMKLEGIETAAGLVILSEYILPSFASWLNLKLSSGISSLLFLKWNIYIFIAVALDETSILVPPHFPVQNIYQSCDLGHPEGLSNVKVSQ